jgi:hypothetical protein
MGTEQGLSQAVSQIDDILADETIQRRADLTASTTQPTTNSSRRELRL